MKNDLKKASVSRTQLKKDLMDLMLIPGLSGHEDRVRRALQRRLSTLGIDTQSDTLGNLHAHFAGEGPRIMLFTHCLLYTSPSPRD